MSTLCWPRNRTPNYTDEVIVVGPNVAWTLADADDLYRAFPEALLGYHVELTTVDSVARGMALRGMRPSKIVVLDGCQRERNWNRAWLEIKMHMAVADFGKIEYWHVHRGEGIWRIR